MSLQYVPDVIYDACQTGAEEVVDLLFFEMEKLNSGQIIEFISNEPMLREDLPAWVRKHKHTMVDRKNFGEISYYYIEKR
jgi:tRNA 2-thiouridine synthesizing protein A